MRIVVGIFRFQKWFDVDLWTFKYCLNVDILAVVARQLFWWPHDIQHNDTQHNAIQHKGLICDTQHYDIQHKGLICDSQHYGI